MIKPTRRSHRVRRHSLLGRRRVRARRHQRRGAGRDRPQETSLTLSQAIAMAEHQTGGKAFDAGVNVDEGKPRVIVETNGTQGVQTVIIDAQSGQIVSAHAGGEPD
jgi:uncharacterized membrane protein YkoI